MEIGEQERVIIVEPLRDPREVPPNNEPGFEPRPAPSTPADPQPDREPVGEPA